MTALRTSIALAALALCVACDGQLLGAAGAADGAGGPGLTPGAAGGGASTTLPGDKPLDCSKAHVAAAPLRRLTREQYDHSIRDLLGVEGHPSLALAADEKLAAFYSNAISPVSRLSVEQYRDSAEDLAEAAVNARLAVAVPLKTPPAPTNSSKASAAASSGARSPPKRPRATAACLTPTRREASARAFG